eukprot:gene4289-6080_t
MHMKQLWVYLSLIDIIESYCYSGWNFLSKYKSTHHQVDFPLQYSINKENTTSGQSNSDKIIKYASDPSYLYSDINSSPYINTNKSKSFLILNNIQSGNNIGNICRNALAFNVHEVIIIGRKNFNDKMRGSDRGAKSRLNFKHFLNSSEALAYLKNEHSCTILGIEIMEQAISILDYEFNVTKNYAFVFGNEGGGLSIKQRSICDDFIYIPQYAKYGMASINVACASAIVFFHFAKLIDYRQSEIQAEKFL